MAERKRAVKTRRREKKNVPQGHVHIQATFNNTIITITDLNGAVISWGSAGVAGFKGSRKSTPYAAALSADGAAKRAMEHGMRQVEVYVKGPGAGREQAIRSLQAAGLEVSAITDVTPIPHNGCRRPSAPVRRENMAVTPHPVAACAAGGRKLSSGTRATKKCAFERGPLPRPARRRRASRRVRTQLRRSEGRRTYRCWSGSPNYFDAENRVLAGANLLRCWRRARHVCTGRVRTSDPARQLGPTALTVNGRPPNIRRSSSSRATSRGPRTHKARSRSSRQGALRSHRPGWLRWMPPPSGAISPRHPATRCRSTSTSSSWSSTTRGNPPS